MIAKIESSTTLINYTVWVEREDGEDWGTLFDNTYHDRTFAPNRVCVIVTSNGHETFSRWAQAREEHGDRWINGTRVFEDEQRWDAPEWLRSAMEAAVEAVRNQ